MNSRERVILSLKHREPDRIPIDFGGTDSTGITAIAYNNLKKFLGIKDDVTRIQNISLQLAEPEEEILEMFTSDVISLDRTLPPSINTNVNWQEWALNDDSKAMVPTSFRASIGNTAISACPELDGKIRLVQDNKGGWQLVENKIIKAIKPRASVFFDDVYHPLEKIESRKEVDQFFEGAYDPKVKYPNLLNEQDVKSIKERASYLCENTDYAITGNFGGSILAGAEYLRGHIKFWSDLIRRKDFADYLEEKIFEYHKKNLRLWLEGVKDYIQIAVFGDDLGHQSGPLISPKIYHEFIQPYQKELYQYVKKNSRLFVFLHSCGSIYSLLPDIINAGVDIINPVQISAKDMEAPKLKKEFGDLLTFWGGGVDTQRILGISSPEKVVDNVIENINTFAPGGGFVFATVHNIQANVPPENVISVFKTIKEFRQYPIRSSK